jgi:hypothetical protein
MDIRKIIKEEMDSFDWTDEVLPKDEVPRIHHGVKVIIGDAVPSATGRILTVQNIYNKGVDGKGDKMVTMTWDNGEESYDYTYDSVMNFTDRGGIWKVMKEDFDWMVGNEPVEGMCIKRVHPTPVWSREQLTSRAYQSVTLGLYSVMNIKDEYTVTSITDLKVGIQSPTKNKSIPRSLFNRWVTMGMITYCDGERISL